MSVDDLRDLTREARWSDDDRRFAADGVAFAERLRYAYLAEKSSASGVSEHAPG